MDELISQTSLFPASPLSQLFCSTGNHVLDEWLLDDMVASSSVVLDEQLCPSSQTILPSPAMEESQTPELPQLPAKRRGRKPGSGSRPATVQSASHVQAERQRRDKLNRRFCDLRAVVPTVSRMDKASLLADAVAYIAELRSRAERLEDEISSNKAAAMVAVAPSSVMSVDAEALDVRMMGMNAAAVRLSTDANHAPARLMVALRSLDLQVQQACVTRVGGMTLQDVVVDVPAAMRDDDDGLRLALLHRLQDMA